MIDSVIFDIGNVLLRFDFGVAIRRIAPHCTLEPAQIGDALEPMKMDLESGRIGGDAFLSEVSKRIGFRAPVGELRAAWQEIFEPIELTHQLVHRWKGTRSLFLLSNTNDLHAEYFLNKYPVFEAFENAVYSHEAGVMKPDPGIYTHAIGKFGVDPSRTLFIDDLAPNIEAARGAGFQVHQYSEAGHERLLEQASALGLL
jgi:putative hydrolase of the HAD superfamily